MGLERLEAWTERGFIEKFVHYIEDCYDSALRRGNSGSFVLGLSCADGQKRRERIAEVFSTLGESDRIDWKRICVFLVEERFGLAAQDQTNAHLVRSTLIATLKRRGVAVSEDRFVFPNTELDSLQRCASEYQTRLLRLFQTDSPEGPHLVTLSLGDDLSLSGIYPDWYRNSPSRWAEAISKSFKVLGTHTNMHDAQEHVCVNFGIIRRARNIFVNMNESTDEAWQRVSDSLIPHDDVPEGQRHVISPTMASDDLERALSEDWRSRRQRRLGRHESDEAEHRSGRNYRDKLRDQPSSIWRSSSQDRRIVLEVVQETPLEYILKYRHITMVLLKVDEENHYTFIILGAAGDLAAKKTFPALFQLHLGNHLPPSSRIIGCDDTEFHKDLSSTDDLWENKLCWHLEKESGWKPRDLRDFRNRIDFMPVTLKNPGAMSDVHKHIKALAKGRSSDHRICYLALPSFLFATAVERFRTECWPESGFARVIVEKPFGRNYKEAHELASNLARCGMKEHEIYRIDHYLAKSLVLNILTVRFANREFGTLFHTWHVSNVRITFQESFGVEGRAGYFNDYGVIRDVMQNHLMQVLTLIAMEAPATLDAEDVRDEKVKVLKQIRPIAPEDCVIGQYEGYQDDEKVKEINEQRGYASRCPTFAVAVLYLDNERWSGVPFIMKAGKALKTTQTLVRVQFRKAPSHSLFGDQPQNEMVIRIQPNEAVYYKMIARMPGISQKAKDVRRTVLDLDLKKGVGDKIPQAYEKLIYDVLQGESHNFVRRDELEQAWRIFDPLLRSLEEEEERVPLPYPVGSGGPRAADDLIKSKGFQKYTPTGVAVSGFSDDEVG
mmetsp:Transcript_111926/g.316304  ORF Transcript_111926/g.316304 Transcript_111926/m.316304 type:complete len:836 (+) Transcript_111926:77-2584(+)